MARTRKNWRKHARATERHSNANKRKRAERKHNRDRAPRYNSRR